MKQCTRCLDVKSEAEFSKDSRAKSGLQSRCKVCQSEVKAEMSDYYRDKHLQSKYGITHQDYLVMLEEQDCKCAICGIEEKYCENQRLAVDHDHDTGQVRALLCKKCNQAIGLLQDNSDFAKSAVEYLIRFGK
jgi:hypothetical protein